MTTHLPGIFLSFLIVIAVAACGSSDTRDGSGDVGTDTADTATDPDSSSDSSSDAGSACTDPDPSSTCLDTGCADGEVCAVDQDGGCVPSVCFCDEPSGSWGCTEDCGEAYVCRPEATGCPAGAPDLGSTCDQDGLRCDYGMECCCGACFASTECSCVEGEWQCGATDACLIDSCAGASCDDDSDCEGGALELSCLDGTCTAPGAGGDPCDFDSQEACDADSACEWILPAACGDPDPLVPLAGCYPAIDCSNAESCPEGTDCFDVTVAPRCYWEDPLCDACEEERSLCLVP